MDKEDLIQLYIKTTDGQEYKIWLTEEQLQAASVEYDSSLECDPDIQFTYKEIK